MRLRPPRLPELTVFGITILHSDSSNEFTLAILHLDHLQRIQLIARDLNVSERDLDFTLSPVLRNTVLPANAFPETENPFILVSVPRFHVESDDEAEQGECLGGVLVLGGRKILFYEVATVERQQRTRNENKRQAKRKASTSEKQLEAARRRDMERDSKKIKPKMSVKWPWSEVTA